MAFGCKGYLELPGVWYQDSVFVSSQLFQVRVGWACGHLARPWHKTEKPFSANKQCVALKHLLKKTSKTQNCAVCEVHNWNNQCFSWALKGGCFSSVDVLTSIKAEKICSFYSLCLLENEPPSITHPCFYTTFSHHLPLPLAAFFFIALSF